MKRILGLGTYPIKHPIHGGQRRVAAFRDFYTSIGIEYRYACVYDRNYGGGHVGPSDVPLTRRSTQFPDVPFIDDLNSGIQAEQDETTFQHFCRLVATFSPDAIQIEQTFMWPLVRRLRSERRVPRASFIYSSQNVEGSLKTELLHNSGIAPGIARRIGETIEQLSIEASRAADVIVAVSVEDAAYYGKTGGDGTAIVIVPNGVSRPPSRIPSTGVADVFGKNPFMLFVGSAYPPNITGFCRLVARDGLFFCPPRLAIAICGGVADAIFQRPEYQRFLHANSARVQFFAEIDDSTLWELKHACHGVLLPILTGGGTNLKTAEALALGKWVVATNIALRGFDRFSNSSGVVIADESQFQKATGRALRSASPALSDDDRLSRESLYWDRCFSDSGLEATLRQLRTRELRSGTFR